MIRNMPISRVCSSTFIVSVLATPNAATNSPSTTIAHRAGNHARDHAVDRTLNVGKRIAAVCRFHRTDFLERITDLGDLRVIGLNDISVHALDAEHLLATSRSRYIVSPPA